MSLNLLTRIPCLYHFTDRVNLQKIKELNGLYSAAKLREMDISFQPGGDQSSISLDISFGMDEFVHLCFISKDHPMEMNIKSRNPQSDLVYLHIDREILYEPEIKFATGVGYAKGVEIVSIDEACERRMIDYDVLYTYMPWGDPMVKPRRRAAELCEVLIPDHVPMRFIKKFSNG